MVSVAFCEAVLAVACSLAVSAGLMLCQASPCPPAPPSATHAFGYCSLRDNYAHVGYMHVFEIWKYASTVPVASEEEADYSSDKMLLWSHEVQLLTWASL